MVANHRAMHRVVFNKKSIYCGYDIKEASRKYFELEPEATEASPLTWDLFVTADNPLKKVQQQRLREAPGPNSGVEVLGFDLTDSEEDD